MRSRRCKLATTRQPDFLLSVPSSASPPASTPSLVILEAPREPLGALSEAPRGRVRARCWGL
eukprot:7019781-Pyramimonas_sp.AAC.1